MDDKVIISCAVTGAVHVPSLSPYLPIAPDEIAESAIGAAQAGAAIVHLHAREPGDGRPSPDPDLFEQFLPRIADETDVVINITTGGGRGMSIDERLAAAERFQPELCSLNMGSMNFGMFPALRTITEFRHDWEQPFLAGSKSWIFQNTFEDVERIVGRLADGGTRFEFECYDIGHLYNLAYYVDAGLVNPPLFIQGIFGILGGIGPDAENLVTMRQVADRLFGGDYIWSVLGAGRHQTRLVTLSAVLGGHVRVGLEDSVYLERGRLAASNADQVAKIARILAELGLTPATPDEAREMLALKGRAAVAIR
jgi:3,5-dioxohexanoate:acetyl-CoA acetone transferase